MITAVWGDCERIAGGWLEQPINAWSSLAFAVVGFAIVASGADHAGRERVDRFVFGVLLVATAAGSFLFHRDPDPAFWHDVTFLATLWFLGVANLTGAFSIGSVTARLVEGAGILCLGLIVALAPETTNVLGAGLLFGLGAVDVVLWRRTPPIKTWYAAALSGAIIGAVFFILGRTGSPLCDPQSVIQLHGIWHVLAAAALGAYFVATTPARMGGVR